MTVRRGVFPGSFNPPTHAHVAIADAARQRHGLDVVELTLSRVTLAKEHVVRPTVEERAEVLAALAERLPWLGVRVTDANLLVDIAAGFDVLIMGADKWHQIHEVGFYASDAERDAAVAALPALAIVARDDLPVPEHHRLDVAIDVGEVSSTAARSGRKELIVAEALASGLWDDAGDLRR